MKIRFATWTLAILFLGAAPAFANGASFNFNFGGPDTALGTSQSYMSNGVTITANGYVCSATDSTSSATLSNCSATNLFAKSDGPSETGLGLAGEGNGENEIGFDGTNADYVIGLNVSSLFNLGATSMTLSFGSVQPGEAYAILGYGSDPFLGSSFMLTNTQAWVGNNGSTRAQVFSSTIGLNANDQFLVLISPCGASLNRPPCGSNMTLDSLTAPTPEPGTLGLLGTGLLALGFALRRRVAAHSV